ncbi:3,4-dihydroxy-2-butanone-4-phosphate synthase [Hoyosella sp. YIM 151337]|uniref:3,4-dihydroxy-2-butanone-4-phosphate synthase n=1 Tax=Hoyosella sp. YIM 151337 TaxID=2992742 RepID=UPI0022355EAE|nr:3,4-dihydroxy-2-butanone-4-phosphate synthase [Hoyosella sp. YIM 151337]MCW4355686.1 3,4-dihydroxy-2-butanone-4-phosphate synthase [Hoyosella sp. YIM 151337]
MNTLSVQDAFVAVAAGSAVLLLDGSTGYLVFAAERATTELVAFAVRHSPGYLRVALPGTACDRLDLPPVCPAPDARTPAYTVSVDAAHDIGTGISAADRARTIRLLASATTQPDELTRPGHVVAERVQDGGLLSRSGPAEAAADLARLAGLQHCGVVTELVSPLDPCRIANAIEVRAFAAQHGLAAVAVTDITAWRRDDEKWVEQVTSARIPTEFGAFRAIGYRSTIDESEHVALVCGDTPFGTGEVLVHVHRECAAGDIFGSLACECRSRLREAMRTIAAHGRGVVLYLRSSEEASSAVTTQILTDLGIHSFAAAFALSHRVREPA